MNESLGDHIRRAVQSSTEGIHESIEAAMEDLRAGMKDLETGLRDRHVDLGELGPGESAEATFSDTVEQHFEMEGPGSLFVSNVSGHVRIRRAEGSVIHILARKQGSRRRMENTYVQITRESGRVAAETKGGQQGVFSVGKHVASVDYDIEVPAGCQVHVKTVSADIVVLGTQGPLELETVSGDAQIDQVNGDCRFTTVSGDIQGQRVTGTLAGRTTSGDIALRDSSLSRFTVNSVSGDFTIDTPLTPGEHYYARTVSGDMQLCIPSQTGATVQLRTVSGDVHSELPAEIIRSGRRNWQGRINGGGANVEMQSVSGDLHVVRSARANGGVSAPPPASVAPAAGVRPAATAQPPMPAASPAPAMPPKPAAPEEPRRDTTSILRALEMGEITVEEALARLEELR